MRSLISQLGHYAARFFGFFGLDPLLPTEQDFVHDRLSANEATIFWQLQPQDQRHSFAVAQKVLDELPDDDEAARAALLHDVGKRHSRLGPFSRSVATVCGHLGIPLSDRMRAYWNHGSLGANDLGLAGSSAFVVEFAARHSEPPDTWAPESAGERWAALFRADT